MGGFQDKLRKKVRYIIICLLCFNLYKKGRKNIVNLYLFVMYTHIEIFRSSWEIFTCLLVWDCEIELNTRIMGWKTSICITIS